MLFIQLLQTALELLHLLTILASKGSFIFNLSSKSSSLLLLALDGLVQFSLYTVQVRDGFLSQFEVTLNLPLQLLNITLGLLFPLKGVFSFVQALLKLALHTSQVVAPVFHGLNILLSLLLTFLTTLLLPVKLGNHVILMLNFLL